jgi:hypothetical protein
LKTAGLLLDGMDVEHVGRDAASWEKVVRKIRTGMMPPSGARRPDRAVLDSFAADLEGRLDRAAIAGANLDAPALHRLNRSEYANAVRDLLALDIDVATLLPADASSEGFDNIADALGVSPSLIESYVSAAMKISRRAVGDRTLTPTQITYSVPGALVQDKHIEGLPLGTRGGLLVRHTFPLDAEYEFSVSGAGPGGGGAGGTTIDVTLDGEQLKAPNVRSFRIPVTAGPHMIGAALVDRVRGAGVDEQYSDFRANSAFIAGGGIGTVVVTGPFKATSPATRPAGTASSSHPSMRATSLGARRRSSRASRTAHRRPATDDEVAMLMTFYERAARTATSRPASSGARPRARGARIPLSRRDRAGRDEARRAYRLSNLDLASRLSFFLWSSIPDDELLDVATKGVRAIRKYCSSRSSACWRIRGQRR